jgi:hypothetical protein
LDTRFEGSNPAEDDGFLISLKSVARLPSEGKYSYRPHAIIYYGLLKNPAKYERDNSSAKFTAIFAKFLPILY